MWKDCECLDAKQFGISEVRVQVRAANLVEVINFWLFCIIFLLL